MRGRTSAEAVNSYRQGVQSLLSCVTNSVVDVAGGYHPAPRPHSLLLNNGQIAWLRGTARFGFQLQQNYLIEAPEARGDLWAVRIVAYSYTLSDSEQREILSYHWHPLGNSRISRPHLHLEQGALVSRPDIRDSHLPTGPLSINDFLRFLIEELSVEPDRLDWELCLQMRTSFIKHKANYIVRLHWLPCIDRYLTPLRLQCIVAMRIGRGSP